MSRHIIIVGSGLAGLTAALRIDALLPEARVTLVTKGALEQSNSAWAQGGIAAAVDDTDNVRAHMADTLAAGVGLCWQDAVEALCTGGPDVIKRLTEWGVRFDQDEFGLERGLEAAHGHPRILHAGGDSTGAAIVNALIDRVRASNIEVCEHSILVELLVTKQRVTGVQLLDADGLTELNADATILASGGAGQLFRHTTNPEVATGDGIAAAYRAGAVLADVEMVQFHPTALAAPGSFLISEAVRGEGATLINQSGERFMRDIDVRAELAPRDVVARGIQQMMREQGGQPVLLDATMLGEPFLSKRFPGITQVCRSHGLNWAQEPIPVTPAAHYWMGGIATDTRGRASLEHLFAVGEVACSGAHGANRLASNSLLETVVFAERAVRALEEPWPEHPPAARWREAQPFAELVRSEPDGIEVVDRVELQTLMWDAVGLARTEETLRSALNQFEWWRPADAEHRVFTDWEDANLLTLARVITTAAIERDESRGAHYRLDFPERAENGGRPIIIRRGATLS
jgi:L-aspartate oxidase